MLQTFNLHLTVRVQLHVVTTKVSLTELSGTYSKKLKDIKMKKVIANLLLISLMIMFSGINEAMAAYVRVKDITQVRGVRENLVVGYGVVVGLSATGDNSRSTQITNRQMLQNL